MSILIAGIVGMATFILIWLLSRSFLLAVPLSIVAFLIALGLLNFSINWLGLLGLFR